MIDEPTSAARQDADLASILVIEDDADTRFMLATLLADDYRVETAVGAEDAVKQVDSAHFEVLLIDISLGGQKSGADLMKEFRRHPHCTDTHMIAMTAHLVGGSGNRFSDEGFDDHLRKPFDLDELRRAIQQGI